MTNETYSCDDCVYSINKDHGYSNYTVEGTEISCLLNKNPSFPIDRWYGEEKSLYYAKDCDLYIEGDGIHLDVDGETTLEDYKNDEKYRIFIEFMGL